MAKKLKDVSELKNDKRTRIFFLVVIILYTFLLYSNTLKNKYSLDDYIIFGNDNQLVEEGVMAIGDIFTTTYKTHNIADGMDKSYGYRPIVRLSYAIEYSIVKMFGANPKAYPWVGHLINILLYIAVILVLYQVLRRMFRGYSIWFPFVITLLFIAHPIHTEVVASIKNRDELLSMLFSLFTLYLLFKYHDKDKVKYLIIGMFMYALAFLSKPSCLAFWLIFPLSLYFFTDMNRRKITYIFGLFALVFVLAGVVPFWLLDRVRNVSMVDNPLFFEDNFWNILGTSFYSLAYYFRLLVVPFPLLYYYGYNMIPVVNLANIWVILSILFHLGLLGIAIWKFREKHVISYAILFYLLTVVMFSNLVKPVVGIIADRFLFIPSIGFAIILAWLAFKLFKANPVSVANKGGRIFFAVVFVVLILIPYTVLTVNRNKDWFSEQSLYNADMKFLENSVKAHDLKGFTSMRKVEVELAKPVNVAKFMMPEIEKALYHFKRATEIWPGHVSSWRNMGMIYNHPRIAEHLKAKEDEAEYLSYKKNAISCFSRAIELEPTDGKALFNLGLTYEFIGKTDSAEYYYELCLQHNPKMINPKSRLANMKFMIGQRQEAIDLNMEIVMRNPNEALPYLNIGNYHMIMGDTLKGIANFEEAAKRNAMPEVFVFLSKYYFDHGDMQKAQFYRNKYDQAVKPR